MNMTSMVTGCGVLPTAGAVDIQTDDGGQIYSSDYVTIKFSLQARTADLFCMTVMSVGASRSILW